jgi:hypothetical protein
MAHAGVVTLAVPDDVTLRGVFQRLGERYGRHLQDTLLPDDGRAPSRVRTFINDEPVEGLDAPLAGKLTPDCVIDIVVLTVMAGA